MENENELVLFASSCVWIINIIAFILLLFLSCFVFSVFFQLFAPSFKCSTMSTWWCVVEMTNLPAFFLRVPKTLFSCNFVCCIVLTTKSNKKCDYHEGSETIQWRRQAVILTKKTKEIDFVLQFWIENNVKRLVLSENELNSFIFSFICYILH